MEELTDETRSELEKLKLEYTDNDSKRAALTISGDAPVVHTLETRSSEGRELRSLIHRANVGEIFDAALSKRSVDGASAEIQQHYGLGPKPDTACPTGENLARRRRTGNPGRDTRAGNVGQEQQTIVPYVFPMSAAMFLGVDMPTVGVGEAVFPVLTAELSVGAPAENAAQAETTGAFSAGRTEPGKVAS